MANAFSKESWRTGLEAPRSLDSCGNGGTPLGRRCHILVGFGRLLELFLLLVPDGGSVPKWDRYFGPSLVPQSLAHQLVAEQGVAEQVSARVA